MTGMQIHTESTRFSGFEYAIVLGVIRAWATLETSIHALTNDAVWSDQLAEQPIPYSGPTVTREEAKAVGLARYFTGMPCKRGHVVERYTTSKNACVLCARDLKAARYARDSEKVKASVKAYRDKNKERLKLEAVAIYAANPDKKRELNKQSRDKYPERVAARNAKWYRENKEKAKAGNLARARANPEVFAAYCRNRRTKLKEAGGKHTASDVLFLLKKQGKKCAYCRVKLDGDYHVDHVMPIALGGSNYRRNLQILCEPCNLSKGAKHPIKFAQELGMLL